MRKFNYGVYICTCNFKSDQYKCWTKHVFVYDSQFKTLHQSKCCGALIYNRADAPIFVLEDKDREEISILDMTLNNSLLVCDMWNMYKK